MSSQSCCCRAATVGTGKATAFVTVGLPCRVGRRRHHGGSQAAGPQPPLRAQTASPRVNPEPGVPVGSLLTPKKAASICVAAVRRDQDLCLSSVEEDLLCVTSTEINKLEKRNGKNSKDPWVEKGCLPLLCLEVASYALVRGKVRRSPSRVVPVTGGFKKETPPLRPLQLSDEPSWQFDGWDCWLVTPCQHHSYSSIYVLS